MQTQTPLQPAFFPHNIPAELKAEARWVCWRNKVPVRTDGAGASTANPRDWAAFDEAYTAAQQRGWGIGFVLGNGWIGIDLDHCLLERQVTPLARWILDLFGSYAERSPSGDGVHIIARASTDLNKRLPGIEAYSSGRYFTVTGSPLSALSLAPPTESDEAVQTLKGKMALWEKLIRAVKRQQPHLLSSDPYSAYGGDESRADQALAGTLVRKLHSLVPPGEVAAEAELAMWLFQTMHRAKWLREDYLARTVAKAVADAQQELSSDGQRPIGKLYTVGADEVARLLRSPEFPIKVRCNALGHLVEVCLGGKWENGKYETALCVILEELGRRGMRASHEAIRTAIGREVESNRYYPPREWLSNLPKWDSTPRLDAWLVKYAGAEDTLLAREAAKRFLIGAAARMFEPGCRMDWMLILFGPQGIGKSTLLRALFGEAYVVSWYFGDDKDSKLQLYSGWCAEAEELAGLRKREIDALKALISAPKDTLRKPYGREHAHYLRHTVLVGTTNDPEILRDPTGNRRFIIVECRPYAIDTKAVQSEREQIWAEAVEAYRRGEKWWWDASDSMDLWKEIMDMHENYEEELPFENEIRAFCQNPFDWLRLEWSGDPGNFAELIRPGFVCVSIIQKTATPKAQTWQIIHALKRMGYQRIEVEKCRFWFDPQQWPEFRGVKHTTRKHVVSIIGTPPDRSGREPEKGLIN